SKLTKRTYIHLQHAIATPNESKLTKHTYIHLQHTITTPNGSKLTKHTYIHLKHAIATPNGSKLTKHTYVHLQHTIKTPKGSKLTKHTHIPLKHAIATSNGSKLTKHTHMPLTHTIATPNGSKLTKHIYIHLQHTITTPNGSKLTKHAHIHLKHAIATTNGSKLTKHTYIHLQHTIATSNGSKLTKHTYIELQHNGSKLTKHTHIHLKHAIATTNGSKLLNILIYTYNIQLQLQTKLPEFYNDPFFKMDGDGLQFLSCDNKSASQPATFNQVVDGLLSDIRDATPKTSNLYAASTRQIISQNATVFATAQCIENITQTICQNCMKSAYEKLSNCPPSIQGRFSDMACFARYSDTRFFNDNQTTDIANVLRGHSSKPVAIVGGAIGGVVLCFLILVLLLIYRLRKKSKKIKQGEFDLNGAVHYNYDELKLATKNFSQENILGKGGYGEVFKAVLDDKNVVAVKKLQVQHARVKEEFENEVKLISNIQHRNLLRLLGWSSEGSNLLLILEYMQNGSLDQFLWGPKKGTLNWNQRYEIIFGIARGLAHLHDEYHVKIVHRDIKSNNILLGDDFRPKIADFGLARFHPEGQSHVTTGFVGTLGYAAPEYALYGILSEKVDTYSFGIVVLEIISGRRSGEVKSYRSVCCLLEDAWEMYENTKHINLIDETLKLNEYEQEHMVNIIVIALLCTQSPASKRPTMSEVVSMLQEGC
ncbi:hypothetical protein R6Q59_013852, partial [Mikania micrantha]